MMSTEWIKELTSPPAVRPVPRVIRIRLWCSTMEREAEVEFIEERGVLSAVKHCSLVGDFEVVDCRKFCLTRIIARDG